jgi:hypothetical protein
MLTRRDIPPKASPKCDRVSFYSIRAGLRLILHRRRGQRARRAILFTLAALVCFRVGYFVLIPGIDIH